MYLINLNNIRMIFSAEIIVYMLVYSSQKKEKSIIQIQGTLHIGMQAHHIN